MSRAAIALSGLLALTACATQAGMREATLKRAAFDLGCEPAKLETVELGAATGGASRILGVSGCAKKATYVVHGDGVNGYIVTLDGEVQPR